jgi:predicted N-acetyltransferase YhbS
MTEDRISIRAERPDDAHVIRDVVRSAYVAIPFSDHREHLMIERLRETKAFVPGLSLLAECDGTPAGHVLLTRARIRNDTGFVETLAFAPLSVTPSFQGRGVGRRLVETAHAAAGALGFQSIVLVGIPGYYSRFGYEPLSRYPVALPFSAPAENCMIIALTPRALAGVSGMVEYGAGWLDH